MNTKLPDDRFSSVHKPTVDMSIQDNFREVPSELVHNHFEGLRNKITGLTNVWQFAARKHPDQFTNSLKLLEFAKCISDTVDLLMLQHDVRQASSNQDISYKTIIDPSDSGFPLIHRDVMLLEQDQGQSQNIIQSAPSDSAIVEDISYAILRGMLPTRSVDRFRLKKYHEKLHATRLPKEVRMSEFQETPADEIVRARQYVERWDKNSNLPRFYTFNLAINPKNNSTQLVQDIQGTIEHNLTIPSMELHQLAMAVGQLDGVTCQQIQRVDIGPFYNSNTQNPQVIDDILKDRPESIIETRSYTIFHRGTERLQSVWNRPIMQLRRKAKSFYTEVIASPRHILMPHTLMQEAQQDGNSKRNTI